MTHYYQGIDTMPRKWGLWYDLVHEFGKHIVGRYGEAAVAQWRFEVWNLFLCLHAVEYLQSLHRRCGMRCDTTEKPDAALVRISHDA
jgi:xylan 1,4-beta-xylosidase